MIFREKPLTARNVQFYGKEVMRLYKTLREVCAETGISRRAIQGYEKLGLLTPANRNKYGHLLYDEAGRKQIQLIWFYQQLGFSLKEIQELLDAPNEVKKVALQNKVAQLEVRYGQLQQLIHQAKQYIAAL